jgi:enoyl-[acyl-carrier-protein] reductase (NADH)
VKVAFIFVVGLLESIPVLIKWIFQIFTPTPPKNVSGQLALITGSSAGIGKSIAQCLAKRGCNIAIVNRNVEMGEKVAQEIIRQYGVKVKAFQADVSEREDVMKLKQNVERTMGTVDILVNNAGLLALENSLLEGNDEDYQKIIDVNLTAYFWVGYNFSINLTNSWFIFLVLLRATKNLIYDSIHFISLQLNRQHERFCQA